MHAIHAGHGKRCGNWSALDPFMHLEPAHIGGLFLLTHVADNYAKRTELFNSDFWTLRAIHFGMERATNLRLQNFSLYRLCNSSMPDTWSMAPNGSCPTRRAPTAVQRLRCTRWLQ